FLQDDVTRKAPSVGLLRDLLDLPDPWSVRRLFLPTSQLVRWQLMHTFERPGGEPTALVARGVCLDAGVVDYLLEGGPTPAYVPSREVAGPAPHQLRHWQAAREVLLGSRGGATDPAGVFVLAGPAGVGQ